MVGAAEEEGNVSRRNKKWEKKEYRLQVMEKDKRYASFMQTLLKAVLSAHQRLRIAESVFLLCVLIETDGMVEVALRTEGQKYSKACEAEGKGHGYGPPHLLLFKALVRTLAEMDVGGANKNKMIALTERFDGEMTDTELNDVCHQLTVRKTWASTTKKMFLAVNAECRPIFSSALTQAGFQLKLGSAPPGALEEQLGRFLQAMPND